MNDEIDLYKKFASDLPDKGSSVSKLSDVGKYLGGTTDWVTLPLSHQQALKRKRHEAQTWMLLSIIVCIHMVKISVCQSFSCTLLYSIPASFHCEINNNSILLALSKG